MMTLLFEELLSISLIATFVSLIICLARLFLKGVPRWITCLLWGLLALRLVCPTLPESKLSFIPSLETEEVQYIEKITASYENAPINQQNPGTVSHSSGFVENKDIAVYVEDNDMKQTSASETRSNEKTPILEIGFYVWLGVAFLMMLYGIFAYLRTKYYFRDAVLRKDNVRLSEKVTSPFVLGFIKPQIYINYNMNKNTKKQVLLHERAHIKRLDHIWKPLGFLLLCLHWFNPLMWVSYILFCRDIEVACDEKVIRNYKSKQKKAYANALLKCSMPSRKLSLSPVAFGEVGVAERIKKTLGYKKPAKIITCFGVAVTLVLSLCLLTDPVNAIEDRTQEDVSNADLSVSVSDESGITETVTESVPETLTVTLTEPISDAYSESATVPSETYTDESSDYYYNTYDSYDYYESDEYYETFVIPELEIEPMTIAPAGTYEFYDGITANNSNKYGGFDHEPIYWDPPRNNPNAINNRNNFGIYNW